MATTPFFGWRIPDLGVQPDGPDAFQKLALDVEATMGNSALTTWTPDWRAQGSSDASAAKVGRYRLDNKGWCDFSASITWSGSVDGGEGPVAVKYPFTPHPDYLQQWVIARLYAPSHGDFMGYLYIAPSVEAWGNIFINQNLSNASDWTLMNRNYGAGGGSGIPTLSGGAYTIQPNGKLVYGGRYRVA